MWGLTKQFQLKLQSKLKVAYPSCAEGPPVNLTGIRHSAALSPSGWIAEFKSGDALSGL